jgi:hypothetical protein
LRPLLAGCVLGLPCNIFLDDRSAVVQMNIG